MVFVFDYIQNNTLSIQIRNEKSEMERESDRKIEKIDK